jgi:hypothetical protein
MPEERREFIEDGEIVSEIEGWYEVVTKDGDGEAHIHRLRKHSTKTRPAPEEIEDIFTRQAPPNRITPTRRVRPEGEFESYVFFGDTHFPYQDKKKIALANLYVRETMPVVVTYLGDDLDMANFSRFDRHSEWLSDTQQGIDEFSEQLAITRANIGNDGLIVVHEGNHNVRFARELRKYNADLLGLKRAQAEEELGVLTLQFLLRCDEMDVTYEDGYPNDVHHHNKDLISFHGDKINSTGLAVHKYLGSMATNFVMGHTHRAGLAYRTWHDGEQERTIWGAEGGTFADHNLAPSGSHSRREDGSIRGTTHNWQTGLWEVKINEEEGLAIPVWHPIGDAVEIDGKLYKS